MWHLLTTQIHFWNPITWTLPKMLSVKPETFPLVALTSLQTLFEPHLNCADFVHVQVIWRNSKLHKKKVKWTILWSSVNIPYNLLFDGCKLLKLPECSFSACVMFNALFRLCGLQLTYEPSHLQGKKTTLTGKTHKLRCKSRFEMWGELEITKKVLTSQAVFKSIWGQMNWVEPSNLVWLKIPKVWK